MTTPATTQDVPNCGALLETAWGVIANAGGTGGDWTAETPTGKTPRRGGGMTTTAGSTRIWTPMTPLSDRDRAQLAQFPIQVPITAVHGPPIPPVDINDAGELSIPPGDYESWTVTTTLGEVIVPRALVALAAEANGGRVYAVDFTPDDTPEQRHRKWDTEMTRLRNHLNSTAAQLLESQ